jgi:hypothetical protein
MFLIIQNLITKRFFIPLMIGFLWLLLFLIVNPIGEFPLNDDWAFSKNVFYLVEQGIFKFSDWPAMTLIVQTLYGAFFCSIFGFSFTVLRFSTIFIGFLGIIFTYLLISELTNKKMMAIIGTILVAINPLFFSLSATFMTDVHFYTFEVLSFLFFFKYMKSNQVKFLVIATLLSIGSTLIRQIGILIPLSFAITYVYRKEHTLKMLVLAGSPFVLTFISLILYNTWFDLSQGARPEYGTFGAIFQKFKEIPNLLFLSFMRTGYILTYIGFFLFPLLLINFQKRWTGLNKKNKVKSVIITSIFLLPIIRMWNAIPTGNVLINFSLGCKTLKDMIEGINNRSALPLWIWKMLVLIALTAAVLLVFTIVTTFLNRKKMMRTNEPATLRKIKLMAISFISLYAILLFLSDYYFDRYILAFIPPILIIVLPIFRYSVKKVSVLITIIFIFGLGTFSTLATHDYLSWNKARWQALNDLMLKDNISPKYIDGGFEFNGWYMPGKKLENSKNKSWWWVDRDDYLVTFGSLPEYNVIKKYPFKAYLGDKSQCIYVLKKELPSTQD